MKDKQCSTKKTCAASMNDTETTMEHMNDNAEVIHMSDGRTENAESYQAAGKKSHYGTGTISEDDDTSSGC